MYVQIKNYKPTLTPTNYEGKNFYLFKGKVPLLFFVLAHPRVPIRSPNGIHRKRKNNG